MVANTNKGDTVFDSNVMVPVLTPDVPACVHPRSTVLIGHRLLFGDVE